VCLCFSLSLSPSPAQPTKPSPSIRGVHHGDEAPANLFVARYSITLMWRIDISPNWVIDYAASSRNFQSLLLSLILLSLGSDHMKAEKSNGKTAGNSSTVGRGYVCGTLRACGLLYRISGGTSLPTYCCSTVDPIRIMHACHGD
jgi:hypothetical protein